MREVRTAPQSTACQIRSATADDLHAIVRIELESFSSPWTHKMFEAELSGNQFSHLWTAWLPSREVSGSPPGEMLIGYVCFWVVFEELRLMNLVVEPRWRRRGIARELARQSLAQGHEAGARRALLEVRASNLAAIRLYEQAGFRPMGVRERYYANPIEDALMMEMDPIQVMAKPLASR